MISTYPELIPQLNKIDEVIKTAGDITAVYTELKSLGLAFLYTGIAIYSTLDQDIKLKLGTSELTVIAGTSKALDGTRYNGTIYQKYSSIAPTTGTLQVLFF